DGSLNLNSGTLQLEVGTNIGSLSAGKNITLASGTTIQFFNYVGTLTRPIIDNGAVFGPNTNTASVIGSNITLNADFNMTPQNANGTGSMTLAGNLTEAGGSRSIQKNNNGTGNSLLILAGTNTFTGGVSVNGGTVQIGNANALNAANPQNVNLNNPTNGSGLRLAGTSIAIGGLSGGNLTAVENNSSTPATLTLANTNDSSYDGTIRNGGGAGSASLSIIKAGNSNTVTLNGTSSYTGTTTINNGTIQLGGGGTSGAIASTSAVSGTSNGTLSINRSDNLTFSNSIGGAVNFVKTNSNNLTYSGSNTSTGQTLVNNGGALIVTGSITGPVNLNNGTLSGTGDGVTGGIVGAINLDGSSKLR